MASKNATTKNTPTVAPEAPVKSEKKIDLAKPIFDRVMALTEAQREGKTPRRLFMEIAAKELSMGERGANTYFQNLKNEAEGKGRYAYAPASTKAAQAAPEPVADATIGSVLAEVRVLGTRLTAMNRQVQKLAKAQQQPSA